MTTKKVAASYSPGVRERAVRLVLEGGGDHPTQWAAIKLVSGKSAARRRRCAGGRAQWSATAGSSPGRRAPTANGSKALEREVRERR